MSFEVYKPRFLGASPPGENIFSNYIVHFINEFIDILKPASPQLSMVLFTERVSSEPAGLPRK